MFFDIKTITQLHETISKCNDHPFPKLYDSFQENKNGRLNDERGVQDDGMKYTLNVT